jgi:hypothetical protein
MNLLLLSFLLATVLGYALLRFLRADPSPSDIPEAQSPGAHPPFVAEAVFSLRDWIFIQRESSPLLSSLFVHERRALATRWLWDCLAQIGKVRANHLRQSRHSGDLDVVSEAKLLLLFCYLAVVCRCLLVAVRFLHPTTPRALALHVHKLAGSILPGQPPETVLARVPVTEISRNRA